MTPSSATDEESVRCLTVVPSAASLTLLDRDRIAATVLLGHMFNRFALMFEGVAGLREVPSMIAKLRREVSSGIDDDVVDDVVRLCHNALMRRECPTLDSFEEEADDWYDSYLS
jgi:hypothetical protein